MGVNSVFDEAAARWRHFIDARGPFVIPFPATVIGTRPPPHDLGAFASFGSLTMTARAPA
jgi:hypothetical protein